MIFYMFPLKIATKSAYSQRKLVFFLYVSADYSNTHRLMSDSR